MIKKNEVTKYRVPKDHFIVQCNLGGAFSEKSDQALGDFKVFTRYREALKVEQRLNKI